MRNGILRIPVFRIHWRHRLALLLIALVVLGVYEPVLITEYGFSDDYPTLLEARSHPPEPKWLVPAMQKLGRTTGAYLLESSYRAAWSVRGLRWLRLLGVAGILVLGVLMYRRLALFAGAAAAACLAAYICTLPPFELCAAWAQTWTYAWAAALTWPAYRLAAGASVRFWPLLGSAGLLVLTLDIYQPAAMFLWFWAAADLLAAERWGWPTLRRLIPILAAFSAASLIHIAIYRAAQLGGSRFAVTTNPGVKLRWFVEEALPRVLRLQWIDGGPWVAAAVVLVILAGLAQPVRIAVFAALLCLSYTSNLLAAEYFASYRTQIAIMPVAALLFGWGLLRSSRWWARGALAALLLVGMVKASSNLLVYIIGPQTRERTYLVAQLRALDPARVTRIAALSGEQAGPPAPANYFSEFGAGSATFPAEYRVLASMILLELKDHGPRVFLVDQYDYRNAPAPTPGTAVVDMSRLGALRP